MIKGIYREDSKEAKTADYALFEYESKTKKILRSWFSDSIVDIKRKYRFIKPTIPFTKHLEVWKRDTDGTIGKNGKAIIVSTDKLYEV